MTNLNTDENESQWGDVLDQLSRSIGKAAFNTHFLGSTARFDGDSVIVSLSPSGNVEQVEARLSGVVKRIVKSTYGRELDIEFRQGKTESFYFSEPQLDYRPEKPDVSVAGAYHDPRNAIIQPDKVEVFTQYFRLKWRRLLGPTLSELIRELRQRCYNKDQRNVFKATYKDLADSIGVSEATVKRLLKRNKDGSFQNEYIGYFVHSIQTVKYAKTQGGIRNEGTRFVIYLDEPLTPDDRELLD